nr:FAD-dependent oxidoreductase [Synechococcus sp. KORDI-52]
MTAARDLQQRGLRTVVIEANDRLGGRTYTVEDEGCPVELGGTLIHWTQPFIWAEKERYGLECDDLGSQRGLSTDWQLHLSPRRASIPTGRLQLGTQCTG